jgi:L-seryl-tRNA(Ser) seleniumtransferase
MCAASPFDPRRRLPALDRLLADRRILDLTAVYGRDRLVVQARQWLARLREELAADPAFDVESRLANLHEELARELAESIGRPLRRVLNATGVFLHTNLGRAPLPAEVAARLPALLTAACDLELDLPTGRRGDRLDRLSALIVALTGAEAALVVNNNAAAMVLALATLAGGREVLLSRGEMVEIGDSFRVPDILAASGARLVEVGTTNRTHRADFARALGPATAALLKVHPSNYRVRGFVAEVPVAELAEIAHSAGLPLLVDEGSGLLRPHPAPQLAGHPSFVELLAAGADLVCGSGDKLLGGPQAGLLAGRRDLVERCRRHPLYRALRLGRPAAAVLEDVLRLHLAGAPLPIDRLWADPAPQRERLRAIAARIGAELVPAAAEVGGGAAPDAPIAGEALALPGDDALAARLRTGEPAVVGYLHDGRLLLDLRTVDPVDDEALVAAIQAARG